MATVEIAFIHPVLNAALDAAYPSAVQVITSSGTSQPTTAVASAGDVAVVTASEGDVYVSFGAAPNASTDAKRRLVVSGQSRAFGGLIAGTKAAIVDV